MPTPLAILRKRTDEVLASFATLSGHDPDEVWAALVSSEEKPELLTEYLEGEDLWDSFQNLRNVEINILKNLRP